MPTHHIRLTNTTGGNLDLYPSSSPLSLTLQAQSSGTHFNYGSSFPNVVSCFLGVDDSNQPELTLGWPGASDPGWGMKLVDGSTSVTETTVGNASKFTFTLPQTGQSSTFALEPSGSGGHGLEVVIERN